MVDDRRQSLLRSFAEHRDALLRFLARKLEDRSLAEDFMQETWLRAANSPGGAVIANPRSYLFRIAANLVLDHQRRVGQHVELKVAEETAAAVADARPSPENIALHRSEFARLVRILDGLSPRCREVFILCRFEELSHAEIARRLGISRNTVVSHMVSALAAIEREMGADED